MATRRKAPNGNGLKKGIVNSPREVTSDKNKSTLKNKKNKAGSSRDKRTATKPLILKDSPYYPLMKMLIEVMQAMIGPLPPPAPCTCFMYGGPTGFGGLPYYDAAGDPQFLANPNGPGRTVRCDGPEGPIYWGV